MQHMFQIDPALLYAWPPDSLDYNYKYNVADNESSEHAHGITDYLKTAAVTIMFKM